MPGLTPTVILGFSYKEMQGLDYKTQWPLVSESQNRSVTAGLGRGCSSAGLKPPPALPIFISAARTCEELPLTPRFSSHQSVRCSGSVCGAARGFSALEVDAAPQGEAPPFQRLEGSCFLLKEGYGGQRDYRDVRTSLVMFSTSTPKTRVPGETSTAASGPSGPPRLPPRAGLSL